MTPRPTLQPSSSSLLFATLRSSRKRYESSHLPVILTTSQRQFLQHTTHSSSVTWKGLTTTRSHIKHLRLRKILVDAISVSLAWEKWDWHLQKEHWLLE